MSARSPLALARTFLFVPADRPERHARALASGAGAVIVDLEDAVAPDRKAAARDAARRRASPRCRGRRAGRLLVRINAAGTPWHDERPRARRTAAAAGPDRRRGAAQGRARPATSRRWPQAVGPARSCSLPLIESAAGLDGDRCARRSAAGAARWCSAISTSRPTSAWPARPTKPSWCRCAWRWCWRRAVPGWRAPVDGVIARLARSRSGSRPMRARAPRRLRRQALHPPEQVAPVQRGASAPSAERTRLGAPRASTRCRPRAAAWSASTAAWSTRRVAREAGAAAVWRQRMIPRIPSLIHNLRRQHEIENQEPGCSASLGAALLRLQRPRLAQAAWPDKPITLVVPYSAGGPTDVVARMLADPDGQVARPDGDRREHRRRRRHHRARAGGARGAQRLHHPDPPHGHGDRAGALQEAVRSTR